MRGNAALRRLLEDRRVPLAGARNFRDCGGYSTLDGRTMRRGMVYRANRLSRLSDADRECLGGMGIVTIFDLRSRREREADPTAWEDNVHVKRCFRPGHKRRLVDMAMDYPATAEGAHALMIDFYAQLPHAMAHVFAEILQRMAVGEAPCIIHCSAGKDRTGMAVALLHAVLGVADKDMIADYALTGLVRQEVADQAAAATKDASRRAFYEKFGVDAVNVMMAARPAYLRAALASISERHGEMEGYLDQIGVDAAVRGQLRERLLEPAA